MTAVSHARRWNLQERVCCPHCWERFPPERCLWISTNPALRGDEHLPEQQKRFRPERFTVDGDAIDLRGYACQDLACPNCHLAVPRACLEMQPMFLSILGAPGSGKSVYLGAMAAELREKLTRDFCLSFADADPEMNAPILGYENSLSQLTGPGGHQQQVVAIEEGVILKTDAALLTDKVRFDSGEVLFPRPMVFTVQPTLGHTNEPKARHFARCVCLYDNAGESFEPGRDTLLQPYTRHLAQAQALLIMIDLSLDADFQKQMRQAACDPRACRWTRRQDDYIHEAARRIRKFARMRETDKFRSPVIVVLSKCDAWWPVLGGKPPNNPWVRPAGAKFCAMDMAAINAISQRCQERIRQTCPRITNAIEGFANDVIYVPVSAAGWNTTFDAQGRPAIQPGAEGQRHWAAVPFLYALRRIAPNLLGEIKRTKG